LISLLPLIYVVFAAGVALTNHRYVTIDDYANPLRFAPHVAFEPDRLAGTLADLSSSLHLSDGASFALQPPPDILVAMNWHLGPYAVAPILWSALASVCVASFGANAHAATDAAY